MMHGLLPMIILLPAVLLLLTFVRLAWGQSDKRIVVSWVAFSLMTASYAYSWLSTAFSGLLGPSYSDLRHRLILGNAAAALAIAVCLCFQKIAARWWLVSASLSLVLYWILIGAINSVV
ncbi:MAG: hypothetical protein WAN23_07235 [Candidatus Acidiferrales bacterium]